MTKQQQKALLIGGVIVVSSYIVRSIVNSAMQLAYSQQQAARQRQQAQNKAKQKEQPKPETKKTAPNANKAQPPARPKPPAPSPYAGIWTGRTGIDGRGVCTLHLELMDKPGESGRFTGFSSVVCNHAGPLVSKGAVNRKAQALNRMDPEAAILSGTLEKTSVELTTEKTVGADTNGCATSAISLTPFGKNQLAAEWKETSCSGGHMVLRKARR
jgi:hypothetical protein